MFNHVGNIVAIAVLGADGIIQYASDHCARMLGRETSADLLGRQIDGLVEQAGPPSSLNWLECDRTIEGQVSTRASGEALRYRLQPMHREENICGLVLLLSREAIDLDLVHARAFHLNPGLSAISVLETGEHLDVNPAWLRSMEYDRADVIGRTAAEMRIWDKGDTTRAQIVSRLREDGHVENLATRMRTRTGKLRDIVVSAELVEYSGRKLAFFASHDITEVRQANAALAALNRELEARIAQRTAEIERKNEELAAAANAAVAANEAKSHFLSMMSHEIRTPLNAVINMTDLLLEKTTIASDNSDYLTSIAGSARALATLVDDILDFARIEAGHLTVTPARTDVGALVEEVARSLAPAAHKKMLDLVLVMDPELPGWAMLDPARLRQILFNLIGNAIKYTSSGWIEVRVVFADGELVFEIVDTGVGISEADQDYIFERFSRIGEHGDNPVQGAGLGLNISAGLVRAMGGSINMSSAAGQGSTFRFTVPLDAFGEPCLFPLPFRVLLVGQGSRTMEICEANLRAHGLDIEVATAQGSASSPFDAVLFVEALPTSDRVETGWRSDADGLYENAVMLKPIGQVATPPSPGVRIESYPISVSSLLAALKPGDVLDGKDREPVLSALVGAHILVADDVAENQLVAKWILEAAGAYVTIVDRGQAALEHLAHSRFDILLLDQRMPGLDGYQTAMCVRGLDGPVARIPIILVSASARPDNERLAAAGIDAFLAKPFTPLGLRIAVDQILASGACASGEEDRTTAATALAVVPILDEAHLDALCDYAGSQVVVAAIDDFLSNIDRRLGSLLLGKAPAQIGHAAHELAGASGSLGLASLAQICQMIEAAGTSHVSERPISMEHLKNRAEEAAEALRAYRNRIAIQERGGFEPVTNKG